MIELERVKLEVFAAQCEIIELQSDIINDLIHVATLEDSTQEKLERVEELRRRL